MLFVTRVISLLPKREYLGHLWRLTGLWVLEDIEIAPIVSECIAVQQRRNLYLLWLDGRRAISSPQNI